MLPSHSRLNGSLPIPCMGCLRHRCSVSLLNKVFFFTGRDRLPWLCEVVPITTVTTTTFALALADRLSLEIP